VIDLWRPVVAVDDPTTDVIIGEWLSDTPMRAAIRR